MKASVQTVAVTLILAAAALSLGRALPSAFEGRMPRVAGASLLDQLLGDARMAVSDRLILKADEYYHGGVRVEDCSHADPHHELDGGAHADPDHDREGGHDSDAAHAARHPRNPWKWINAHVHIAEHRHLASNRSSELMPWYWAAARVNPGNVNAWLLAADAIYHDLGNPAEGLRVLNAGIRHNPDSAELELDAARIHLNGFRDLPAARACLERARTKWTRAREAGKEADGHVMMRILFYLCHLAKQRDDSAALIRYAAEARELGIPGGAFDAILKLAEP